MEVSEGSVRRQKRRLSAGRTAVKCCEVERRESGCPLGNHS